jgi:hypothetical protein
MVGETYMMNLASFEDHKYDGVLVLLCFLGGALAGYLLMHHAALLGI